MPPGTVHLSGDGGVSEQMTDAEPASSPEAQVQVKFRPSIQVTALTPFPFAFYSFRLLPESQHYYIPFNAFNSRLRRRREQVR